MAVVDRLSTFVVDIAEHHPGAVVGATAAVSGTVLAVVDGSLTPSVAAAAAVLSAMTGLVVTVMKVLLADIRHLRARITELEHAERERAAAMDAERADLIARIRHLEDRDRGDGR